MVRNVSGIVGGRLIEICVEFVAEICGGNLVRNVGGISGGRLIDICVEFIAKIWSEMLVEILADICSIFWKLLVQFTAEFASRIVGGNIGRICSVNFGTICIFPCTNSLHAATCLVLGFNFSCATTK